MLWTSARRALSARGLNAELRAITTTQQQLQRLEQLLVRSPASDIDVPNASLAMSMLGRQGSRNLTVVNKVLDALHQPIPARHLCAILFSISAGRLLPAIPQFLAAQAETMDLSACSAQDIANSVWSFAKLRQTPQTYFERVSDHLTSSPKQLTQFTPQQLANVVWATSMNSPALLLAVCDEICAREKRTTGPPPPHSSSFNLKDMATILSCCAKARPSAVISDNHRRHQVFECFARQIAASPDLLTGRAAAASSSSRDLASIIWSFAAVKLHVPPEFEQALLRLRVEDFSPQDLVNICWSFAREGRAVWVDEVDAYIDSGASRLSIKDELNLLWASTELGRDGSKCCARIVQAGGADLANFSPVDLAHSLHAFAKCGYSVDDAFLQRFLHRLREKNTTTVFSTPMLSNMVWAAGKLNAAELADELWPELRRRLHQQHGGGGGVNSRDVANAMWGFATLNRAEPCAAFARHLLQKPAGKPLFRTEQEASNTVWAFAKLGFVDSASSSALWPRLAKEVARDLRAQVASGGSSPQALSMLLWSFATMKHALTSDNGDRQLVCDAVALCIQRGHREAFLVGDICKLLWAFRELGAKVPLVADRFAREVACVELANLDDIGSVLWAFAKLPHKCPALCAKLSARMMALQSGNDAPPQDKQLISILNAFAVLDYRRNTLCESVAQQLGGLALPQLTELLFAFAQLRYRPDDLVDRLSPAAAITTNISIINSSSSSTLSKLVYALANLRFGMKPGEEAAAKLCARIAEEVHRRRHRAESLPLRDLTMLVWGFACMDVLAEPAVKELVGEVLPMLVEQQVRQRSEDDDHVGDLAPLLELASVAWEQTTRPGSTTPPAASSPPPQQQQQQPSQTHARAFAALKHKFGLEDLESERWLELSTTAASTFLSVDMYSPSLNAVIEVDGPHHFFHDNVTRTGKTEFKRRVLERAGYKVHSLHVLELQSIQGEDQMLEALASALRKPN